MHVHVVSAVQAKHTALVALVRQAIHAVCLPLLHAALAGTSARDTVPQGTVTYHFAVVELLARLGLACGGFARLVLDRPTTARVRCVRHIELICGIQVRSGVLGDLALNVVVHWIVLLVCRHLGRVATVRAKDARRAGARLEAGPIEQVDHSEGDREDLTRPGPKGSSSKAMRMWETGLAYPEAREAAISHTSGQGQG